MPSTHQLAPRTSKRKPRLGGRGFQIRSAGFRGLRLLSRIRQPPRRNEVAPKWFRGCNPEGTSATKELLIDLYLFVRRSSCKFEGEAWAERQSSQPRDCAFAK